VYSPEVITALRKVWAILDAPCGKRLAPFLPDIVDRLLACGELSISDEIRYQLVRMSAATIDRRLAPDLTHLATALAHAGILREATTTPKRAS